MLKLNQKGALDPIVIILLILVLAMGGYISWTVLKSDKEETPAETTQITQKDTNTEQQESAQEEVVVPEGWKTFEDETAAYTFSYPGSEKWNLAYNKKEEGYTTIDTIVTYECGLNCGSVFSLYWFDSGTDFESTVQAAREQIEDGPSHKLTEEEYYIGDVKAVKLIDSHPDSANAIMVFAEYNNYVYEISVNDNGASADGVNLTEKGLEILETFRFK